MGLQGGIAGSNTQLQYNNGGGFGASSNMTYNQSTNIFTYGAGNTGGAYNIIGSLFQGVVSGSPVGTDAPATAKFGYLENGQCVELATAAGIAVVDFHSNNGQNLDFDARISSTGGTPGVVGGGALNFQAATLRSYAPINILDKTTYLADDQGVGNVNGSYVWYRKVRQPVMYQETLTFTPTANAGTNQSTLNLAGTIFTSDKFTVTVVVANTDYGSNPGFTALSAAARTYSGNQITQITVAYTNNSAVLTRIGMTIFFTPL
jgi:hypothetical protein